MRDSYIYIGFLLISLSLSIISVLVVFKPDTSLASSLNQSYSSGANTDTNSDPLPSTSITIDKFNNVFVADSGNHRIQKFEGGGRFITSWKY